MAAFIKKTDYATPENIAALLEELSLEGSGQGASSGTKTVLV
jgi:hypothetical protein